MAIVSASIIKPKTRRAVILVQALQKKGKTDFSLRDTPEPITFFNGDSGLEGVIEPFLKKGKKIRIAGREQKGFYPSYALPSNINDMTLDQSKLIALPIWNEFTKDFRKAQTDDTRTIVVDTAGAFFDLGLTAYVGSSQKVSGKEDPFQRKSSALKRLFRSMMLECINGDKNVIFLARAKQVWKDNEPVDDKYDAEGWTGLPFEVQFTLQLDRKTWNGVNTFTGRITDSRIRGDQAVGMKFGGKGEPALSFRSVCATVFGTELSEWK